MSRLFSGTAARRCFAQGLPFCIFFRRINCARRKVKVATCSDSSCGKTTEYGIHAHNLEESVKIKSIISSNKDVDLKNKDVCVPKCVLVCVPVCVPMCVPVCVPVCVSVCGLCVCAPLWPKT